MEIDQVDVGVTALVRRVGQLRAVAVQVGAGADRPIVGDGACVEAVHVGQVKFLRSALDWR